MVTAFVQVTEAFEWAPSALTTPAFGSSVTGGNLIAVFVEWSSSTVTLDSITDSQSNSYTLVNNPTTSGSGRAAMGYATNVTGGASFTVTANFSSAPSANAVIVAHEVSGTDTTSPLDGNTINHQSSPGTGTDAITSTAITTTEDGDYIFGCCCENNSGEWALDPVAGTGFTQRHLETSQGYTSEDQVQSSSGSIAATFTTSVTGGNIFTGIMAFTEPAAAGRTTRNIRSHPLGIRHGHNMGISG